MIIKRSNDLVENTTIDRISNSRYQNANKRYIIFVKKKKKKVRSRYIYKIIIINR